MTTRHELTAADGTPEEPLPDVPALTAREDEHRWMNRALLAEAQLAVLKAAYQPASTPTNQEK
ncbi:hypothetical protein OUO20_13705 [Arthrobacter sp. FX8]|uniref:hypothetical protein n=1 Tax=Arthrobacter sp. FX8 TaxID=2997335 RepID=UPI00227A4E49|nr:hypothetical protein [Arthrobacter sp. FX8]WAJ32214.1 hypothetical protein OUO20_13705 [Arthrobacter sp. FX8]